MKIYHRHIVVWLLLENYINGNEWQSAGKFGDKEVFMGSLGWQFVSYKGSTRISDTVFKEMKGHTVERKTFKSRSGHDYYKYRLIDGFKPTSFPRDYWSILKIFQLTETYQKYKHDKTKTKNQIL